MNLDAIITIIPPMIYLKKMSVIGAIDVKAIFVPTKEPPHSRAAMVIYA